MSDITGNNDKEKLNKKNIFTSIVFVTLGAMVSCFLWGSAYPMIKLGYKEFEISSEMMTSQILFAGIRFTLAGILAILLGCIIQRKILLPKKSSIPMILKLSMFQTVGQYFFFYVGLAHTTGVRASIVQGTNVFVVLVVSSFIFRQEKLSFGKVIGCTIGFLGVVIINLTDGGLGEGNIIFGDLFIFLSTVAYAFSSVLLKEYTKKEDPVVLSGYQFIVGGLIMTLVGFLMGGRLETVTARGVADIIYLAFVSAVAYSVWGILMKYNPVSRVSIYGFLAPVFGVILSIILLNEGAGFGILHLAALVLVCAGIIVVNRDGNKKVLLVSAGLVVLILLGIVAATAKDWEDSFLLYLQDNVRTDFFNPIMRFFSFLGNSGWFWIVLCVVLLIYKPTRPIGIIAAVSLLISAGICNGLLKVIINRTRPYDAIEELNLIAKLPHDSSFPSGHSNASFAVACAITWCLSKERRWVGFILIAVAAIIAFSRLYVGAHYPTDVIAGILLGFGTSVVTYLLLRKKVLKSKNEKVNKIS